VQDACELSGGGGLNQARRILIRRHRTCTCGGRRRPTAAADGGGRRRQPVAGLTGEPYLGLQSFIRRAEGIYVQRAGRRSQRGRRLRRRRGGVGVRRGGATRLRRQSPATAPRRYGVQGRRQATRAGSSPPDADLGRFHDDETAATSEDQRRRRLGFSGDDVRRWGGG
jgi:hypothetical protein